MAVSTIWIPPGTWYEKTTGTLLTGASDGSSLLTKSFDLSEIPIFIRGGAIIPKVPVPPGNTLGIARRQYTTLILDIYPGSNSGSIKLYEDDGISVDYLDNKVAWTQISYTINGAVLTLVISPATGNYPGFPSTRNYIIRLNNGLPVGLGTVNGNQIVYSRFDLPNSWKYDDDLTTVITTPFLPTTSSVTVVINTITTAINLSGLRGAIHNAILAKRNLDPDWGTPGSNSVFDGYLSQLASAGFELSYLAGVDVSTFYTVINSLRGLYANATAEIQKLKPTEAPYPPNALVQLWSASRNDSLLCGTTDCINANPQYAYVRIEGYQPTQGANTVPLYDYWDPLPTVTDNYATTLSSPPPGYTTTNFQNGNIFDTVHHQPDHSFPVSIWWSDERQDMLTVASQAGVSYAQTNNYVQKVQCIGYAQTGNDQSVLAVPLSRWSYSMELLLNAVN
jgi:hypothetical protein